MSGYKTIVVHLADERRVDRTLVVAVELARQQDAHLVGLFVSLPDLLSPPLGVGRSLVASGRATIRERAEKIRQKFEAAGAGLGLKKEWRFVEPGRAPAIDALLIHVRAADLIVAAQGDLTWDDNLLMEYPEELLMQSGRPVLFVPNVGELQNFALRPLIAWSQRREASRAVFDALPLLQKAETVRVLWINPDVAGKDEAGKGEPPTADIAKTLSRHGVNCTPATTHGADADVGKALLHEVKESGATMLVMGGYGHYRFREYVFGGATRHILRNMTVPSLLSH
jgi:nucleotide-binding universal stress UspA family protein